jgi:hypothetical protein
MQRPTTALHKWRAYMQLIVIPLVWSPVQTNERPAVAQIPA